MVTIQDDTQISAEQLSTVFKASGIIRPYDDLDRLQKMIDHSDFIITAWDNENLVGVARGVTDFSYCCYLSDLAESVILILRSSEDAMDYYPKVGFKKN